MFIGKVGVGRGGTGERLKKRLVWWGFGGDLVCLGVVFVFGGVVVWLQEFLSLNTWCFIFFDMSSLFFAWFLGSVWLLGGWSGVVDFSLWMDV